MLSAVLPSSVQPPHVLLTTVFIGVISCVVAISSAIVSSQMLPSLLLLPAPVLLPSATMSSAAINIVAYTASKATLQRMTPLHHKLPLT
jgi:hypothetical protein